MPALRLSLALLLVACGSPPVPDAGADFGSAPDQGIDAVRDAGPPALPDTDGDSVRDRDEGAPDRDTDCDGQPDYLDLDADGDGLPDAEEAGDLDPRTPPVDTDGDGTPDLRDLDSDDDRIIDAQEVELGTDPTRADSDGDGVDDLVEWATGTLNDPIDDLPGRSVLAVVVPFRVDAEPESVVLSFRLAPRRVDAYFLLDRTASMADEVSRLRSELRDLMDGLTCADSGIPCTGDHGCSVGEICGTGGRCIEDPLVNGCVESLHTGVGSFFGLSDSYRHALPPQADPAATADAIPAADSADGEEAVFQSASCVADPTACFGALCEPPSVSIVGCAGFRDDAIRVAVVITDACDGVEPCGDGTSASAAGGRLSLAGIDAVAIDASTGCGGETDLRRLGVAANTLDRRGRPIVRCGDGEEVGNAVTDALRAVLENESAPFVDVEVTDLPDDDGDGVQFIQRITAYDSVPGCVAGRQRGCFVLDVRINTRVRELRDAPQVYRVAVTAFADGSPVDTQPVVFIVPPDPFELGPDEEPMRDCRL